LQSFKLHLAPVQGPLIVLLEHHGGDQACDGSVVGKDAHDVGSPFDLGVEPFERVGAVDLVPKLRPIEGNGRHAVGDLDEQSFVGKLSPESLLSQVHGGRLNLTTPN